MTKRYTEIKREFYFHPNIKVQNMSLIIYLDFTEHRSDLQNMNYKTINKNWDD